MSINSDLQQINVFSKGMNTDTSDAFLSNEQYRYAENLRFITEEASSNGGELRCIEGWKELNVLPIQETEPLDGIKIIATSTIRDKIVIVGKNSSNEWGVWTVFVQNDEESFYPSFCHFGLCSEPIGENISIVTRYESDKNVKVYIADGIHLLMSINIANNNYSGKEIKDIASKLEIAIPQITTHIQNNQDSRIQAPVLLYAYVLYKLGGPSTSISPLSEPIVLYDSNRGYYNGQLINKSILLTLELDDYEGADRIKVYRIGYTQNGHDPDIAIIYDDEFTGNFEFTDIGYDIANVTAAEFIAQNGMLFKPLLIESKNDYLFAANIQYNQQDIDVKFKDCTATYEVVTDDEDSYSIDIYNNIKHGKYKASFKRGETYRFGIVFYDKAGKKSSVIINTIHDVTIPTNSVFLATQDRYNISPYRIVATILNIPEDCSGYEIVRCKRGINDSRCITQGIVGRAYKIEDISKQTLTRFAFQYLTLDKYGIRGNSGDDNESGGVSCSDLAMFASPEYVYQPDDVKLVLNNFNTHLKLKVISNHPIPTKSISGSLYRLFINPHIDDSVNMTLDQAQDLIQLGTGEMVHDYYRENGEYFMLKYNGNSPDRYDAIPGGIIEVDGSLYDKFTSAMEYRSDNQLDRYINICKLFPIDTFDETQISNDNVYYNIKINAVNYIDSPNRKFSEDRRVFIDDDKVPVGDLNFVNWDALTFYGRMGYFNQSGYNPASSDLWNVTNNDKWWAFGVTAGGKYILLNAEIPELLIAAGSDRNSITTWPISLSIAEIVHDNVIPYGGDTEISKQNSVFYSFGDYLAHDGSDTGLVKTTNGDCYTSMFVFNSGHAYDSAEYNSRMYPTVYIAPIESTIDLRATYGDLYTTMTSRYKYWFLDLAGVYGKLTQEKNAYLYNTVYSANKDLMSYTPLKYNYLSNDKFDCRVHYSQIKVNGENIDSWLNFKVADFIDVDTRYGLLTDLNLFKDTLVFWQDLAAGVLAVNERTMLLDVNDTNIILGNGDVLLRYDYLTTLYGMKPAQKARTQSNNALYWWDSYNKEIIQYPGGNQVLPLKKVKTVSKYVNNNIEEDKVSLAYDPKYAEILMCLGKQNTDKEKETLVYNEYIQLFTGVYTMDFNFSSKLPEHLILAGHYKLYKWRKGNKFLGWEPVLKYIVNKDSTRTKVYDNIEFGMGESFMYDEFYTDVTDNKEADWENQPCRLGFLFKTPLDLSSSIQKNITKREYDLRLAIPRNKNSEYGDRLRGRTMLCTITNTGMNVGFSLQYIITKYRISYS